MRDLLFSYVPCYQSNIIRLVTKGIQFFNIDVIVQKHFSLFRSNNIVKMLGLTPLCAPRKIQWLYHPNHTTHLWD